jgi:hypothetical protein
VQSGGLHRVIASYISSKDTKVLQGSTCKVNAR